MALTSYEIRKIAEYTAQKVIDQLKGEKMVSTDRTLNAKQTAEMLNVSVKTVYRLCSTGSLPYRKVGNKLLFSQHSLYQYLHR